MSARDLFPDLTAAAVAAAAIVLFILCFAQSRTAAAQVGGRIGAPGEPLLTPDPTSPVPEIGSTRDRRGPVDPSARLYVDSYDTADGPGVDENELKDYYRRRQDVRDDVAEARAEEYEAELDDAVDAMTDEVWLRRAYRLRGQPYGPPMEESVFTHDWYDAEADFGTYYSQF